ncbi:hypothetical protein [Bacillus velezensis]|uniref:hypothetical protein n=1 Tax=Bacillus velezensis TaxID=492670 RepID=UPI0018E76786|nr:hypothetical protein [Bacillus velezensis]
MGTLLLVEEFIEGRDLRQWIAQEYPFFRDEDGDSICNHAKNIKNIVTTLCSDRSNA